MLAWVAKAPETFDFFFQFKLNETLSAVVDDTL